MNNNIAKLIILIGSLLLLEYDINGQWSRKLPSEIVNSNTFVQVGDDNIIVYKPSADQDLVLSSFDNTGKLDWVRRLDNLKFPQACLSLIGIRSNEPFLSLSNGSIIIARPIQTFNSSKFSIINLDIDGSIKWEKIITHDINFRALPEILQIDSNSFYVAASARTSNATNKISMLHFSIEGELLSENQIIDNKELEFDVYKFFKIDVNKIALIKIFNENQTIVTFFDQNMDYLESFQANFLVNQILFDNGEYYLAGEPSPFDVFDAPPVLTKLDADLNIVWAKKMDVSFLSNFYKLQIIGEELYHKAYSLNQSTSIISKMSKDGTVLDQVASQSRTVRPTRTFNAYQNNSLIDVLAQGDDLALHEITVDLQSSCFLPKVCVDMFDFEVNISKLSNSIYDPDNLDVVIEDIQTQVEALSLDIEDICFEPNFSFPVPYFVVDDTICVNEEIEVVNLQNETAVEVNWSLEGSNIENSTSNNPGAFSYDTPGTYIIAQQIVFEECTDDFLREIVVVNSLDTSFDDKIELCDPKDILLDASNEEILSYTWQDGSMEPTFLATEEGSYLVTFEDKHCIQETIFEVDYFDFEEITVNLGEDTVICEQRPLEIKPNINAGVDFEWQDGHPNQERVINETGNYVLTTTLGACNTTTEILVEVEDCASKVFVPNVFSPNGDGINDDIFPLGEQFELLEFQIFDKWGNQVHNQLDPWNGKVASKSAPLGVYVYFLLIQNNKLEVREELKGEFTLLK